LFIVPSAITARVAEIEFFGGSADDCTLH